MNPQQLFNNFQSACLYWAKNNGDPNVNVASFRLFDDGSGNISISSWFSTAPQPTTEQLLSITLLEAQSIARARSVQDNLKANVLFSATTTEIASVITPPIGQLVFNSTIQAPQIYCSNVWKTFTIA
jgi:hypothetical protein